MGLLTKRVFGGQNGSRLATYNNSNEFYSLSFRLIKGGKLHYYTARLKNFIL